MTLSAVTPKANRLLATLPEAAYRRLLPDLEPLKLRVGETLFRPAGRLQYAYFPTTSIVTLAYAVDEEGAKAEAWPVGREGMVGISLFLGGPKRNSRAAVQIDGVAFRIPALALLAEFQRAGALQQLLLRYVFALVTQASQLGVCSYYHSVDRRFCRFLSLVFDRVPGDDVVITQERIAGLLGVTRGSISNAAVRLHNAGVIEYRRGHVQLISRTKLDARACACAAIIRRAFASVTK
jgi:CRP-like cAMP-binding protein